MPYFDAAYRRAASYDLNGDGLVSQRELPRTPAATAVLDRNHDGRVSVYELADGFRRGDVKIRNGELKAMYEPDFRPYAPPPPPPVILYPRRDYDNQRREERREDNIVGGTIVGGFLGAAAGALLGGRDGAAAGAIIGGTVGAVSGASDR